MVKLKDRNILITGGAGFIGSHLVDALVNDNEITVLDNLSASTTKFIDGLIKSNQITFIKGDIRNIDDVKRSLRDIDLVFHYAAQPDVKKSIAEPIYDFEINVRGSINILELMRKNDISEIVFASSGGTIYGDKPPLPTPENQPLRPISNYGAAKAAIEMYLSSFSNSYGFTAVSLRYANIFGPRSNHGVIYDFYFKLKKNPHELEILGNGLQNKSYMYISDCIDASLFVASHVSGGYIPFNIGSESQITVNEIAKIIIDELSLGDVKFRYTGGDRGWVGDVPITLPDLSKLKNLGWESKVSTEDGIRKYVRWLKEFYG